MHCVQNTYGAELVSDISANETATTATTAKIDEIIEKGTDKRVEMYSAFRDPFKEPIVSESGLSASLKQKGITHVYVVGLAFDYCVKWSAVDAKKDGFEVFIIKEGVRSVDPEKDEDTRREIEKEGVRVVGMESDEVGWVLGE